MATYSPTFGGIPNLPTSSSVSSQIMDMLNKIAPGIGGATGTSMDFINDLLAGKGGESAMKQTRAEQAVRSGLPGTSGTQGTLQGNALVVDSGDRALKNQQQGFTDLFAMLQGLSGTAVPTFGQGQDQGNAAAIYAATPDPSASVPYAMQQFKDMMALMKPPTPAGGTQLIGGLPGGSSGSLPSSTTGFSTSFAPTAGRTFFSNNYYANQGRSPYTVYG
jgi:hypothetical protein